MTELGLNEAAVLESGRIGALRALDILDTPAEEAFDRITQMAAELFDTPIALVTLVDETRQWFKSRVGLDPPETPRDEAFCNFTIRNDQVMVVPDAQQDDRFIDNPLVVGDPNIRFYAGAPLRLASGFRIGSICIIDTKPRELSQIEQRRLATLAQIVVDEMELRVRTQQLEVARVKAESAVQAKSDFLANMSHELRTPLTSIIGFAGLMNASGSLGARERHFSERIQAASQNLLVLVNDVLDFAKLEAGQVQIVMSAEPLTGFLETILAMFGEQAAAKGLSLVLKIDPAVPNVVTLDPHAVRQVLANLLSNAIKFTSKGEISLCVSLLGDGGLSLTVQDTGPGIPADRLDQIFERFVQADSSVSRRFGGTGLGLSISRRLALLMGGDLTVKSVVGEGSVFELTLPARSSPPQPVSGTTRLDQGPAH